MSDDEKGSGGETTFTVVLAFFANAGIALAKTLVALGTGSASMLAESAHSWADTGNEVLLLVADKRSRRAPDETRAARVRPGGVRLVDVRGHGALRRRLGGLDLERRDQAVRASEDASYFWAYVVLGIAFVLEGVSFAQAYRQTRREAHGLDRRVVEHALTTSDPTLRAVFAEDSAALAGLVIATLGIFLHQVTGNAAYDAVGSILVGILLGVVAVVLINRNRWFLTGQESSPGIRERVLGDLKAMPEIAKVAYLRLEFVGPRQLLLVASIDLTGERPESDVAYTLRDLEHRIERNPNLVDAVLTLATPDEAAL